MVLIVIAVALYRQLLTTTLTTVRESLTQPGYVLRSSGSGLLESFVSTAQRASQLQGMEACVSGSRSRVTEVKPLRSPQHKHPTPIQSRHSATRLSVSANSTFVWYGIWEAHCAGTVVQAEVNLTPWRECAQGSQLLRHLLYVCVVASNACQTPVAALPKVMVHRSAGVSNEAMNTACRRPSKGGFTYVITQVNSPAFVAGPRKPTTRTDPTDHRSGMPSMLGVRWMSS